MNMNSLIPNDLMRVNRCCTKRNLILTDVCACVLAALLLVAAVPESRAAADANLSKLQPGAVLPELFIDQDMTPEQRRYLGLRTGFLGMFAGRGFRPGDVAGDVLVIEFFNIYCTSCQTQAPIMNEVFRRINAQAGLRDRVKFFGIGAGNNQNEAASFARRYSSAFPLFADPDFINYEAVGAPGATPLTLVVLRSGTDLLVVSAHAGLVRDPDVFVREIQRALRVTPAELAQRRADARPVDQPRSSRLEHGLTEAQIDAKVLESLRRATDGDVEFESVRRQTWPRNGEFHVATAVLDGVRTTMYAQVVSRPPTCDVCHGVHFIVVFDDSGIVRHFEPVYLTKYGNVEWDRRDADFMRRRLVGLDIKRPFTYNPSVDSVTTATMTSVIIYNSVQRLKEAFDEIKGN